MSDPTPNDDLNRARPRASLRGKGWEILRGESVPKEETVVEEGAALTAEEQSAQEEVVLDWIAAPELSKMKGGASSVPDRVRESEAEAESAPGAVPAQTMLGAEEHEAIPRVESFAMGRPLPATGYEPRSEVEGLIPLQPEQFLPEAPAPAEAPSTTDFEEGGVAVPAVEHSLDLESDGVVIRQQDTRIDAGKLSPVSKVSRPPASDLFAGERDVVPDDDLLDRFVTDERMERLWLEIESQQADLVGRVQGNREVLDAYQKELLQASALLLQNRANYDDVRAILFRVRADLARDEKTRQDTRKYKPQILIYLSLATLLWLILMGLEPVFSRFVSEVVGLQALKLIYHPTLFGMLGAIVNAYFTLNKHTIQLRDFDPIHMSWYLMNPLIGIIMGLLMTLVFGTGIISTVGVGLLEQTNAQVLGQYPFLLWVLCFLAGYNQNVVLRLLQRTFNMLRGSDESDGGGSRTPDTPSSPAG
jgi:hypothetical protein